MPPGPRAGRLLALTEQESKLVSTAGKSPAVSVLRTRKPALGMGGWTGVSPSTDGCDLEGTQVDGSGPLTFGMVSENKTATPWALPTGRDTSGKGQSGTPNDPQD